MRVGITGTRYGGTEFQLSRIRATLEYAFEEGDEFLHGGCVGVDQQAAHIAKEIGYRVICFPGPDVVYEGQFPCDEMREVQTNFKRNRAIVDYSDLLLVVPRERERQTRGGTWYTHDYAKKRNRTMLLIPPVYFYSKPEL